MRNNVDTAKVLSYVDDYPSNIENFGNLTVHSKGEKYEK